LRVRFTTRPVAVSDAWNTGRRKLIDSSRVVYDWPRLQRRGEGAAHGRVREVAEDAAVQRAHRVRVALLRLHLEDRALAVDLDQPEADEPRDRRRALLAVDHRAHDVEVRLHAVSVQSASSARA
jgi:hypothetical protein